MPWLSILLSVLLLLLIGLAFHALRLARRRSADSVLPLNQILPDGVAPRPRMLLYFYSEHCSACRTVTPLVDALHQEDDGVVKLDVRRHLMTARYFDIRSTPALVLVDSGRLAGVHFGAIGEVTLLQFYGGQRVG